jgi:GH15 family glucan-1,4-alpha-glucosidase
LENHVGNDLVHRLGVWVDEQLSWTSDPAWQIKITMSDEALVGQFTATHPGLEIKLESTDLVFNEKNIFIRRIKVQNLASRERLIKIFFGQEFEMYQSHMAHTAYFDPHHHCVVHYRNKRAFAINAQLEGKPFDEFCTGVFGSEGKQGTFLDAADGKLEKNPIEHGRADSVIGASETYRAGEAKIVSYWVAVGYAIKEVLALNQMVIDRGIGHIIESTANYWRAWVNRRNFNFHGLAPETVGLFKKITVDYSGSCR